MITFLDLGNYGRFGNQLWQIASTVGIARQNGLSFAFPHWQYQQYFKNFRSEELWNVVFNTYEEENPYYKDIKLTAGFNWNLKGYFQSYKYFRNYKEEVTKLLSFPRLLLKGVAVHVRRGDYLNLQHIHPVLPMEYYDEAFKYFKGETFTIFSDDIAWCKENFKGKKINFFEPNGNDFLDFSYMSGFNKFIIANSSFSWWAAYLSAGESEVIAPKTWVTNEVFDDRVPKEWIRL